MDSKAIFPEQLKKGIQDKTYLPKQVFNAYKFVLFGRRCFLEDLFIIVQNTYLILFLSLFSTVSYFYKWQFHLSSYFF